MVGEVAAACSTSISTLAKYLLALPGQPSVTLLLLL
jgi:hypothetical protein